MDDQRATTRISTFSIPGMDCPSEERLIRLQLDALASVEHLDFDLERRKLRVWHRGAADVVLDGLQPLGLGARLDRSDEAVEAPDTASDPASEARVLRQLLAINGAMFVIELGLGLIAQSTGLVADSVDMFADAAVYGLALHAVGRTAAHQQRAAKLSGWLQLALALGVFAEVARRAVFGSHPVELMMIGVASLALVANTTCVALLAKHRHGGVHLKASWIFTASDALANLGVIVAGALVFLTGSAWPDLVVGTCVAALVLWSAVRILRLR